MEQFPRWIYSATGSKVIESEDEHPGEGWYDSPAHIPAPEFIEPEFTEPEKRKPGRPRKVTE